VFYINPSRRGPVTPFSGFSGSEPGEAREAPFWGFFWKIPLFGGFWVRDPGGVSRLPVPGRAFSGADPRPVQGLKGTRPAWIGAGCAQGKR